MKTAEYHQIVDLTNAGSRSTYRSILAGYKPRMIKEFISYHIGTMTLTAAGDTTSVNLQYCTQAFIGFRITDMAA